MILKVDFFDEEYPVFDVRESVAKNLYHHKVFYYHGVTDDLHNLVYKWKRILPAYDGQFSGVLADYLQENLPLDKPLNALISHLRMRFNSPKFNQ
jgi:hypothetical protein